MRISVDLDDELVETAKSYTGIATDGELVHQALKLLVAREAGIRLAKMGGTMPNIQDIPRRRWKREWWIVRWLRGVGKFE